MCPAYNYPISWAKEIVGTAGIGTLGSDYRNGETKNAQI